jgi:uncharacterized protein (TIGR02466 family)
MESKLISELFATPVISGIVPKYLYQGLDIEVIKLIDIDSLEKTNWATTSDDLHQNDKFSQLTDFIINETKKVSEQELKLAQDSIQISCMWANVHKSGSKHHFHQHPNSFLSGVMYLNIPSDSIDSPGRLTFIDPRTAKNMVYADFVSDSCISYRNWSFSPTTGDIFIFPSWLEHGTDTFISLNNSLRISLSFNFILKKCSWPTMKFDIKEN